MWLTLIESAEIVNSNQSIQCSKVESIRWRERSIDIQQSVE